MPINIIYSRVSKEDETEQDLEIQEKKLIEKFKISNPKILRERGSAYDMKKFHKREKFIKIIKYLFDNKNTKIIELFQNTYNKEIRLYVWDSHRLMRNVQYSLLFLLLSDIFGIEIYTYKDGKLKENDKETPSKKLLRYMILTIHAYSGEEYSYTTSENIKKAFISKPGITYTRKKGLKVGKKFTRPDGTKINISFIENIKLNNRICHLHKYYLSKGQKTYYKKIIRRIIKEYNIILSKSYISRLKKRKEVKV